MAIRYVNLPPKEAYEKISEGLTGRFLSSEEITSHVTRLPGGNASVVGVFEKYSFRNSNRMTMTVLCSPDGRGGSEVFFVASGAGSGVLGLFDFGAEKDFEAAVESSIERFLVRDPDS